MDDRAVGIPRRRFVQVLGGAAAGGALARLVPGLDALLSPAEARSLIDEPFPIDDGLARRVLAAAGDRGATFTEIYLERRISTRLTLVDGQVQSIEQGILSGCGVRAVHGQRVGYATTDRFDADALMAAARRAAAIAHASATDFGSITFEPVDAPDVVRIERSLTDVTAGERAEWLSRADLAARAHSPTVTQVSASHSDEERRFAVINSEGVWAEDRLPLVYLSVNVNARTDAGRGLGQARYSLRQGAEQMTSEGVDDTAREAARQAVRMCEAGPAPAGEMPVVLASGGGVLFHEAVGHGLEGDYAMRGTSFYAGRIGEKVGSTRVTIVDGARLPDLRGSFDVDDEGTPAYQNTLIEAGILRKFMTDRIAAESLGAPLTGNGRRESYRYPPLVRMTNTFIDPGTDDVGEMVESVRRGLFAAALGGGEVDTTSGNFTFGVREAYLIENGEVTRPVRGANLVGNGPEILSRIDRVGPDQGWWVGSCGKGQWVPVTCGAPTLRISSMTVGGAEKS